MIQPMTFKNDSIVQKGFEDAMKWEIVAKG